MRIDDFTLENWLNPACDSEKNRYYLGGSCVEPITVEELFSLTGESMESFFEELKHMNLGYPRFEGTPRTRKALSKLYKTVNPDEIILCHGGTGANATVCYALLEATDNIVSIMPNYQQFFSIPRSIGTELREVDLKIKDGYKLDLSEVRAAADKNTKAIMFTNPNNPTGQLMSREYLRELLEHCRQQGIIVVLDECFIEFCETDREQPRSLLGKIDQYENLLLVRAFTKSFAMPGVRLGYLVCSNEGLREKIRRQLPEWNLSVFAHRAGIVCAEQAEQYLQDTVEYVKTERAYLREGLEAPGIRVVSGEADFLLIYTTQPIYDRLLAKGILIRNCENFRGLGEGYYRIAVKKQEENGMLLDELEQCLS